MDPFASVDYPSYQYVPPPPPPPPKPPDPTDIHDFASAMWEDPNHGGESGRKDSV